jgi:hypothetical protein
MTSLPGEKASPCARVVHRDPEGKSRAWRPGLAVLDGGHVKIDAGKIFEHHRTWRAALKPGKSLDVSKAALASVDHSIRTHGIRTAMLR